MMLEDGPPTIDSTIKRSKRSDLFADETVIDQFGKEYRFKSDLILNKAVVINTMYTVCRGSCPGTSAMLGRIRKSLTEVFGSRVTLLSITIDPAQDDRQAMLQYASIYDADKPAEKDQANWLFLTGQVDSIERLRRSLGFFDLNPKVDIDPTKHDSLLLFGNDSTDRWATSPTDLRDGLILEPLRRILGVTNFERFGKAVLSASAKSK